jgi:hypothetical protein
MLQAGSRQCVVFAQWLSLVLLYTQVGIVQLVK